MTHARACAEGHVSYFAKFKSRICRIQCLRDNNGHHDCKRDTVRLPRKLSSSPLWTLRQRLHPLSTTEDDERLQSFRKTKRLLKIRPISQSLSDSKSYGIVLRVSYLLFTSLDNTLTRLEYHCFWIISDLCRKKIAVRKYRKPCQ